MIMEIIVNNSVKIEKSKEKYNSNINNEKTDKKKVNSILIIHTKNRMKKDENF